MRGSWIIRIVGISLLAPQLPTVVAVVTAVLLILDALALIFVPGWPGSCRRRS